jgi:hypothetical protein
MNWPTPKDFNDAVRKPAAAFADPDLAAADAVLGTDGRPVPHTGESSAVYQLCAEDGRSWAVKCFIRPSSSRAARYRAIRERFEQSAPSFAVPFEYLAEGLRAGGQRCAILKMDWVEGQPLNRVAKDRADSTAVLDRLFRRWVELARELRTVGVAHGDIQHANVVLVPGSWPGAYTLKLIDYDAMFLPDLTNAPSYETGHKNYQHPDRTERLHSPDLDRFPLLVVATALKALAVRGPSLWKRYGADDNMLFTADDFRDPAGSALLRKLWESGNAPLRALTGELVLACRQPISETPWLDQLVPPGVEPTLSDARAREVEAVLYSAAVPVPAVEAFTLDDEPEPSPPRRASKPLTPVPVLTDDEEDDAPRPRARPRGGRNAKSRREEPSRGFALIVAAIVGVLLAAGVVAAGVWLAVRANLADTAQPPAEEPPRQPGEPTPPQPAPPQPAPEPPEPVFAGPPEFHRLCAAPINDERGTAKPYITPDKSAVFVSVSSRIDAFDAKTGAARPGLRGRVPSFAYHMWALDRDRIAVFGYPHKVPGLWDAKTGESLPDPLARDPLPPPPPGILATALELQLSPDGRYCFAGYQGPLRGQSFGPAPYCVVEAATGNVIVRGDWTFGTARFTADGARLLVTETNGRVRWVKTATGETEIEWAFQPSLFPRMIGGLSDDGSLFVYNGRPAALPTDNYLIDGKTGQVLRKLGFGFSGDRCTLSADGRYVSGIFTELNPQRFAAVLADARTGEVLVRTPLEGGMNDLQRASVTPDGKAFVVYHRGNREIAVYTLRGKVPESNEPAPPPLSLVPARAPPLAAVGMDVPPPPPPPPVVGRPPLPEAPLLKPSWTVETEAKIASNQLPQAPIYSRDGKTIILSGGLAGTIPTFDAKTGAAGAVFDGHKVPGGVHWVLPFGTDRVVSFGFDAKQATWDTRTGERVEDVKFPELPPIPLNGRGHAGITYAVSPGGRYTVAARKEALRPAIPGPLRILDTTTGKEVVSAAWNGGRVVFTADESRVLVLDGLRKATWYKLPSGEADGEWLTGEGVQAEFARLLGVSADGKKVLYHGPLVDQTSGVYLLDGTTGKPLRKLGGAPYQPTFSALSPDGRFVAMAAIDFSRGVVWCVDVFEAEQWKLVGRVAAPARSEREPAHFGFSPNGKELAVFYPSAKEVRVFPLPEK